MNIVISPAEAQAAMDQADRILNDAIKHRVPGTYGTTAPHHTLDDVQPITIRNAGLVLREASKRLKAAELVKFNADAAAEEADRALREAQAAVKQAKHLLEVSALQPNGGEA